MAKNSSFVRAMNTLLPDALITVIHQHEWYSMTFAGKQLRLTIALKGPDAKPRMERLAAALPDHEFDLPGQIVGDIAIEPLRREGKAVLLEIEVLILDD